MKYDDWASRYDEDTRRYGWCAPQRVIDAATERVPTGPELRVLDLGVGTGQCSAPFLAAGATVVGVDAAPAMLEQAAKRGAFSRLVELKLGALPLRDAVHEDAPFDVVLACGVLHFVRDLAGLLDELGPLVRPGAVLSMTTIPPQPRAFGPSTQTSPPAQIGRWLDRAGFTVHVQSDFVAYYDQADREDPVQYTLSVATLG